MQNKLCKRIIPCLDVKDGRVVKGVNFVDIRDVGDPVEAAVRYNEAGADELVLLDINASYTIYDLINRQKERGVAVIYVGEDLDVLLELADRILVLCGGKVSGIVPGRGATKRDVGMMMTQLGGNEAHA